MKLGDWIFCSSWVQRNRERERRKMDKLQHLPPDELLIPPSSGPADVWACTLRLAAGLSVSFASVIFTDALWQGCQRRPISVLYFIQCTRPTAPLPPNHSVITGLGKTSDSSHLRDHSASRRQAAAAASVTGHGGDSYVVNTQKHSQKQTSFFYFYLNLFVWCLTFSSDESCI